MPPSSARRAIDKVRPSAWEYRNARVMIPVRILIGIWLLTLTAIFYGYGLGGWWGLLLVPAAALHFYFAYRLRHPVKGAGSRGTPP